MNDPQHRQDAQRQMISPDQVRVPVIAPEPPNTSTPKEAATDHEASLALSAPSTEPAPPTPRKRGVVWSVLALLGLVLFKGKWILLLLLSKLKFLLGILKLKSLLGILKTGGSMLVAIGVYALAWPLSFAVGFTVLMLVHELGHALALRALGIPFSAPLFIPFVGALIGLKQMPPDAAKEALVAGAGPFAGTVAAQVCLVLFTKTGHPVLLGLAQAGYLLNLFNLAPYSPLDGGRMVGALSPKIWLVALPLMILLGLYLHSFIVIIIALLGVPRALAAWKKTPESQSYYAISPRARLLTLLSYLGLAGFLALMMSHAHGLSSR